MKTEGGVSGHQMDSLLANLWRKYGRGIVERGSREATMFQNNQYNDFFYIKKEEFEGRDGDMVIRPLVFLFQLNFFLIKLAENRGGKKRKKTNQ